MIRQLTQALLQMAIFCGVILIFWGNLAVASELVPREGMLLVAQKNIVDPRFQQSVILLIQHDEGGTGGIIINRPSRLPLRELFAGKLEFSKLNGNLFYGGPVAPQFLLALIRTPMPVPDLLEQVADGLCIAGIEQLLEWLTTQPEIPEYRIYAGYTGWAPGQLAHEINRGDWKILPVDVEKVFSKDLSNLWENLRKTQVL